MNELKSYEEFVAERSAATLTGSERILVNGSPTKYTTPDALKAHAATDPSLVHVTGDEVITGQKTFRNSTSETSAGNPLLIETINPGTKGIRIVGSNYTGSPTTVPPSANLKFWLKADSLGLSDGAQITTWTDSAASPHSPTQATSNNRPTYRTNVLNGQPVVRFDGSNDELVTSSFTGSDVFTSDTVTIVAVIKQDSTASINGLLSWAAPNTTNIINVHPTFSNTLYFDYGNRSSGGRTNIAQPSDWDDTWHVLRLDRRGTVVKYYIDGELFYTSSMSDDLDVTVSAPLQIGRAESSYFKGDVAEIIIYDSYLNTTDAGALDNYIYDKYALGSPPNRQTANFVEIVDGANNVLAKINALGEVYAKIKDAGGRVISIESEGGVADGQIVEDGAMTSGSAILTSDSGLFSAQDVGKIICVRGAGSAGGRLSTTVASYQSSTQVTLATNASTTASSCRVVWGTNNSSAYLSALDKSESDGVDVVSFGAGIYCLGSSVSREYSNKTIVGGRNGATTLIGTSPITLTQLGPTSTVSRSVYNNSVIGINFDLNYMCTGLSMPNNVDYIIDDCQFTRSYQEYQVKLGQYASDPENHYARRGLMRNCKLTKNTSTTVESINLSQMQDMDFVNVTWDDADFWGLFTWYAEDIRFHDCYASNGHGIAIQGRGPTILNNVQFTNAQFEITAAQNVTFNGGSMRATETDGSVNPAYMKITGTFYDPTSAEQAWYQDQGPIKSSNIVMNGFVFHQTTFNPILVESYFTHRGSKYIGVEDITLNNVIFDGCYWPPDISAKNVTLNNCRSINNAYHATSNPCGFLLGGETVIINSSTALDNRVVTHPTTAPTATINATAGNLNGAYIYRVSFVTAAGETLAPISSSSVSPINQRVDLTAIPIGPASVTSRKIYRTAGGGADGTQKLLATIADNTTTTYADNTADGSLGANLPVNNTATTPTQTVSAIFENVLEEQGFVTGMNVIMRDNNFPNGVKFNRSGSQTTKPPAQISMLGSNNIGVNPEKTYAQGSITGATTFTRVNGRTITATLTGSVTATVADGIVPGDRLTRIFTMGGAGSYTYTKASNEKLVGGAFVPSAGVGDISTLTQEWDGTYWVEVSRALGLS